MINITILIAAFGNMIGNSKNSMCLYDIACMI